MRRKDMPDYRDFGKRIDGAYKFHNEELEYKDIDNLSTLEKYEQATKDNIWPKPKLGRKDRFVEYCIDCLRSTARKKAKEKTEGSIKGYYDQLCQVRDLAESCQTKEQVFKLINLFNKKRFSHVFFRKVNTKALTEEKMEAVHFGETKDDIALKRAENTIKLLPYDRSNCEVDGTRCTYILDGNRRVFRLETDFDESFLDEGNSMLVNNNKIINFKASKNDYKNEIKNFFEDYKAKNKRVHHFSNRLKLGHLDACNRDGTDYRNGTNMTSEAFQDAFGFYGGQFGRWVMYKERTELLNIAFDALCDLAETLDINIKDISHKGETGIAFGARGVGRAQAHYELEQKVICLTRVRGAGYLAEEWFHSLDHHLSIINGISTDYYSRRRGKYESFNKLLEKVADPRRKFTAESISIDSYEDRDKPHWAAPENMLARAFTSYVVDKLKEEGKYNDFLAYEFKDIKTEDGYEFSLYPHGEERKELNRLFDQLFEELRSEGILEPFRVMDIKK